MKYHVESIGASFNDKDIEGLSARLTAMSGHGWEFHSVFSVEKTGCLGLNKGNTYLAVFCAANQPLTMQAHQGQPQSFKPQGGQPGQPGR